MAVTQIELARLFEKSQSWVAKKQLRKVDPLPRDFRGAREWGIRNNLITEEECPEQEINSELPANAEEADIRLKIARHKKLQLEIDKYRGELLSKDEVEEREALNSAEFRRAAVSYPARVKAVLVRHLEPDLVDKINADLAPIAADLLSKSDPRDILKDMTEEDFRAMVVNHAAELLGIDAGRIRIEGA